MIGRQFGCSVLLKGGHQDRMPMTFCGKKTERCGGFTERE